MESASFGKRLIAQTRKCKLEYFQDVFKGNDAVDELLSMEEIEEEADAVRQELHEKRKLVSLQTEVPVADNIGITR